MAAMTVLAASYNPTKVVFKNESYLKLFSSCSNEQGEFDFTAKCLLTLLSNS